MFHLTQASALLPMARSLERRGIDVSPQLELARIPRGLLVTGYAPIPKRSHFWQMLDSVASIDGFETIGFLSGEKLDLTLTGPWGRNILRAISLHDAIQRASMSICHFAQGNSVSLTRHRGTATLRAVNEDPVFCRTADHTGLLLLITLVEMVADPGWKPKRASLRSDHLKSVEQLSLFDSCELRFSADDTSVEFPEKYLTRPLSTDVTGPAGTLYQLPDDGKLSSQLQVLLATFLPHYGCLPAEEAAEIIGISRTTLFRQLTEEGETYRNLTERVRYTAARQYLAGGSLSVKEISQQLGYQNPNNFTRAFHRIAGISPTRFRLQTAADAGLHGL